MKKILTSTLICLFILTSTIKKLNAADLVVAGGGAGGAYLTIGAALAAASANDRIIVYPQVGGSSFSEGTLTINKSIQILSANEGAYYAVDGNINITPSAAGMSVTIIGMKLFTGGIQSTIAAPVGARCVVNLLNDSLAQGAITFNHDNYNLTTASNYIQGGITFRFGKVIGNIIKANITVNTDASVNNPTDTVLIIGNKIAFYSTSLTTAGVYWTSNSQFFSIQNNYIHSTYQGYYDHNTNVGIYVTASKASIAGSNSILNNTITKAGGLPLYYGLLITTNATSMTDIQNNIDMEPTYYYGLQATGGTFSIHYNYFKNPSFFGFTNDGTNVIATNTTINSEGLNTNALSNTINGGNPDSAFVDLNLTRNDAGCYGGSFTLNNFFPITNNDWARVILVTAPRRVLVNGTINVKAIGFDK
jgi:hypothetical protein